jgi:hypothetical protein
VIAKEDIELFPEMLERSIEMYEAAREQIAKADPAGFQPGLDNLTLWHTLNSILNYYRILNKGLRGDIHFHLRREVIADQHRKESARKAQIADAKRNAQLSLDLTSA